MQKHFFLLFLSLCSLLSGKTYFVSPNGQDTNPGTVNQPIFSLNKVWTLISAGDTIYLRGGIYRYPSTQFLTGKNGTNSLPIKVWAYPGEIPIISKSETFIYKWSSGVCFTGDYFHWKGLEFSGFTQVTSNVTTGFRVTDGSNNIFELINSHHNGHGMVITGKSGNNLVLNSDFHHNEDPLTTLKYNNADGLEICYIPAGLSNTVKGCRFWWNTDDGIDLWLNEGTVIIDSCWAWNNGYIPDTFTSAGNGNGFKLGRTDTDHGATVLRKIRNSVSYNNKARGFDENEAKCSMELYNNTAYLNGTNSYVFNSNNIYSDVKNCISFQNSLGPAFSSISSIKNCIFSDKNPTLDVGSLSNSDFLSLDASQLTRPRSSDGHLPAIDFLKPSPGSKLVDSGVAAGLPFFGVAPDIGAFETITTAPVIVNKNPVISISSPLKSASFTSPATITINATASDPDGTITKVEFFQGNVKIGEKIALPHSITWKEVPEGTYSLTAVATDNAGSRTVSVAVSVTVAKPVPAINQLPIIDILSPTKSSSFTAPATITVDVNASDKDGSISKIELFNGSVKLTETSSAPYSFTLKDLTEGTYNLKAVATDNLKASSTSSILQITVVANNEKKEYFNLYPNPNNGLFTVDFTSLIDAESFIVTIVDLKGKTVHREQLSAEESSKQFDLSHLYSGIYVIMITANQILLTQKFIKN